MLTKVEIVNVRGDVLSLPLSDFSGGYLVEDIQGLDPVKATLTSSSMAQVDGAQPQSSRRETRNITMKLGIKPDYVSTTVDGLRTALYSYLMPKSFSTLNFYKDDSFFASTLAQIESLENNMFSQDPEMDASLICFDPDFYAPAPVIVNGSTVSTSDTVTIDYPGTSDAGVIFTLTANRDISGFSLFNTRPDNISQALVFEGSILTGDVVTVTTIPRQKSVILTRANAPSSVLYGIQPAVSWTSLASGHNLFRAFANGAPIPYTLQYTPKYGAL